MIFLSEIKDMKMYNKKVYFPLNDNDKKKGSIVYLLTPNIESSIKTINSKIFINKYFMCYYIERDITFFIANESVSKLSKIFFKKHNIDYIEENNNFILINNKKVNSIINEDITMEEIDNISVLSEAAGDEQLSSSRYNQLLKAIIYKERLKTPKDIVPIFDRIKKECPDIKKTFLYLNKYKNFNMFLDFFYYNESFFKNNYLKNDKGLDLYLELMNRFINDDRFNEYQTKHVFVPVHDWKDTVVDKDFTIYRNDINPISVIYRLLRANYLRLKNTFKNLVFVFYTDNGYFKMDMNNVTDKTYTLFLRYVNILGNNQPIINDDADNMSSSESKNAIKLNIIDKLEKGKLQIKVNKLTGDSEDITEKELLDRIDQAAEVSSTSDEAIEILEDDDTFKALLLSLSNRSEVDVQINTSRRQRLDKLNDEFKEKELKGIKVKDLLEPNDDDIETLDLSKRIDTVNEEEWSKLKYTNFEQHYNMDKDIVACINKFSTTSYPVAVRDISVEDTSTSEDFKETYTVLCEDSTGKRFSYKIDVPKFKDGKFPILKGNDKTINGQLMLLPVTKTEPDTVQIVSNYKKIFIRRFGNKIGSVSDRIVKALNKTTKIKIVKGNSNIPNMRYTLSFEYNELCKIYNKIETSNTILYFNQDEIRKKYNLTEKDVDGRLPYGYDKTNKAVLYSNNDNIILDILTRLQMNDEFSSIYANCTVGKKFTYSRASILNTQIPLIIIGAYNIGLSNFLNRAKIEYEIVEKLNIDRKSNDKSFIKFKDGYMVYNTTSRTELLMSGLKDVATELYSIQDINSKQMYVDMFENYGMRAKIADGLDNFYDCMIDPMTEDVLKHYKLPTDYIDLLIYASDLLVDTDYIEHTSMLGKRYRSNEMIAGYVYQALSTAYVEYKNKLKKGMKDATMSMKQSAAIDAILTNNTTSDASYNNALSELEMINTVTNKGLSGMNSTRAYKLDKRGYDESMVNILGLSTNFAGNAGVVRQTTIDMNIDGTRGYINIDKNKDNMNISKTFTATEAITSFSATRNDPIRVAMDFIQTSKHQLRTKWAFPSLITNGMDEALPYMISNNFAFKSKNDGIVKEITPQYMILEYKDKTYELVDLRNNIRKNSDGGFFIELQLSTKLKVGDKVKKGDIVAYDKLSFSDKAGWNENLAYQQGIPVKGAVINTDDCYEDSAVISDWLSHAMETPIVVKKEVVLKKDDIIFEMASKGDPVQEGDVIMVFQNSFDEEDATALIKSLSDEVDVISDLGRFIIKSKVTGSIDDIKIYRTVEKDQLSESIRKQVNKFEKDVNIMTSAMKKYNIEYVHGIEPTYTLPETGKLKDVREGVKIEFYLKYDDTMSVGDKVVYQSAIKGVNRTIFPIGKEPYSEYRKDEKIHTFLSIGGQNARMVTSPLLVGGIYKALIECDRQCKEDLGIPIKYLDDPSFYE